MILCRRCEEPILPGDDVHRDSPDMHHECAARQMLGSQAHIEKRCGCFIPGSGDGDPPGMTKREAARAMWQSFCNGGRLWVQ